ncbi:hypothetical protein VTH82DRAFT_1803 [Thermothelomyces myriococcoides]
MGHNLPVYASLAARGQRHGRPVTTVRTLATVKPTRDLRTRLLAASAGMDDAESRDLNHFIDLLERCLTLNPEKRLVPADALKHPFFTQRVYGYGHGHGHGR